MNSATLTVRACVHVFKCVCSIKHLLWLVSLSERELKTDRQNICPSHWAHRERARDRPTDRRTEKRETKRDCSRLLLTYSPDRSVRSGGELSKALCHQTYGGLAWWGVRSAARGREVKSPRPSSNTISLWWLPRSVWEGRWRYGWLKKWCVQYEGSVIVS